LPDEGLDPIPGQSHLEQALIPLWERFKEFKSKPISKHDKRQLNKEILAAFQRFHAWLIDEVILKHMNNDIYATGMFAGVPLQEMVDSMPQLYRNFARTFLQGQMFNFYSEHLLKIVKEKRPEKLAPTSPVVPSKPRLIKRASLALEEIGKDLTDVVREVLKKS
jgi:hypothetical protein